MRFHSKPYFLSAALFIAAAAPSGPGSSEPGKGEAEQDPAGSTLAAPPADDAVRGRVEEGNEQRARYDRSPSEAQPAPRADRKSNPADDLAADPFVRQIWTAP